MKKSRFVTGDLVMLKSGGPKMTVFRAAVEHSVVCCYFDWMGDLKRDVFSSDMLRRTSAFERTEGIK
jgi:uncharacterized protein YodC (DUF2158 family)